MNSGQTPEKRQTSIHPQARIGRVCLESSEIESLAEFYREQIGMQKLDCLNGTVLLVIEEIPEIRRQPRSAGLFHFALRFPDRPSLAAAPDRGGTRAPASQRSAEYGAVLYPSAGFRPDDALRFPDRFRVRRRLPPQRRVQCLGSPIRAALRTGFRRLELLHNPASR